MLVLNKELKGKRKTKELKINLQNKMPKFRKKPVVIEAVQWFNQGDVDVVEVVPSYLDQVTNRQVCGWVKTLEGGHIVSPGDWIITGVNGENYPCKPDIFDKTYESVED